jgi:hypothetical protein
MLCLKGFQVRSGPALAESAINRHASVMRATLASGVAATLALIGVGAPLAGTGGQPLVRPGVAIGDVQLGTSIQQARRALGQPLIFEESERIPNDTLRYLQYTTRDGRWTIGFFGSRGKERVARIVSTAPRARTRSGIGVGNPVPTLYTRLRPHSPVCIQRQPFFNYVLHEMRVVSCAVRTPGATTAFLGGNPDCAADIIRYQGCARIRISVGSVMIEGDILRRFGLSWWYPVTVIPEPPVTAQR